MVSWYFALAQLGIEALQWIVNFLMWLSQQKEKEEEEDMSPDAQYQKFQSDNQGITGQLSNLTPKFGVGGLGS
jgi:hypothetical protein